jgi:tetratricopeptide (TPR) repeat protein
MSRADRATFQHLATTFPSMVNTIAFYELMVLAGPAGDDGRAIELLELLIAEDYQPQTDAFFIKYTPNATLGLEIAEGIAVTVRVDRNALGLSLAELYQKADALPNAIRVVENLDPTTIAAVSLAELYASQRRWADVVELTEGVANEDDASTYLLVQRGRAFREQGLHTAAREALKEALRLRSRSADLRLPALVERGLSYLAEGKKSMARKDFERVLAERSNYPEIVEILNSLTES